MLWSLGKSYLRIPTWMMLVLAAGLFSFVTWQYYLEIKTESEQHIDRQLETAADFALARLQTIKSTMTRIDDALHGLTDGDIRSAGSRIHQKLEQLAGDLPQIKSIRVIDGSGHLVFNDVLDTRPATADAGSAQSAGNKSGLDIRPVSDADGSFVVSQRRSSPNQDSGTIDVSFGPAHFQRFYEMVRETSGDFAALVRADGAVIARYGASEAEVRSLWLKAVPSQTNIPDRVTFKAKLDRDDVYAGFSRVGPFPVYLLTGIERASLRTAWFSTTETRALAGLQVMIVLFLLAFAFQRRRHHAQQAWASANPEQRHPPAVGRFVATDRYPPAE
ncbi:MAG: hypothetical protein EPO23_07575 [Xanthobacteraceae bacterium]|nr:MAG: hypothetical protein EPO23_07575 [Xanthobacteraceae bacterium]